MKEMSLRISVSMTRLAPLVVLWLVASSSWAQNLVAGYYPMWTRGTLPASAVRFDLLTHINHAFAWPLTNGSIDAYDTATDTALINRTHKAGRKILISMGGASESGGFAPMAADSAIRSTFIQNLVTYIISRGYDGVDLDWEGPSTAAEKANEVKLVREIRQAFQQTNPSLLLTMAVGVTNWSGQWHDFATLKQYVDWFNAMTYDFHGSWTSHAGHNSPLYAPSNDYDGSCDQGIAYLNVTRGIPTSQLLLGLPYYGKRFTASALYGASTACTDLAYADVATLINQGWTYVWDVTSQVPYLKAPANNYIVTFDDSASLTIKCTYAKSKQLRGVMMWALGQDKIGSSQPLMEAVGKAMLGTSDVAERATHGRPGGYDLRQNYPNPFNPTTVVSYQLPEACEAKLVLYDLLGREVATLVDEERPAGISTVTFDASHLNSGVYLYRLTAGSYSATKSMVVLK
jgi:chitinase